jgi:peptidoglycan/LPS O-acetylase OafA/YrhL
MTYKKLTDPQTLYLDFIRTIAAMSVLFGHAAIMFQSGGFLEKANFHAAGVIIFFLMSGFLISYSVFTRQDDPSYGFREYFIDRFARIYTAFLPALFFVTVVDFFSIKKLEALPEGVLTMSDRIENLTQNYNFATWLGNLTMVHDFPLFQVLRKIGIDSSLFIDEFGSASPFWTICIEWWIYMAFGIIVLTLFKAKQPVTLTRLVVFLFVMVTPGYYFVGGPIDHLSFLWAFGMGAAWAFLYFPGWLRSKNINLTKQDVRKICAGVITVSILCMVARFVSLKADRIFKPDEPIFGELQFSVFLTIAIFSIVFLLGTYEKAPKKIHAFFKFTAGYSYSLYLIHMTIMCYLFIANPGSEHSKEMFWTSIAISNVVSIAFWWLFERHYRAIGKWLKNKTTKA